MKFNDILMAIDNNTMIRVTMEMYGMRKMVQMDRLWYISLSSIIWYARSYMIQLISGD